MASSNSAAEPNETTSLLTKDATKPVDPSLSGNGLSSGNGVADSDVENGEVETRSGEQEEGDENPLFEGQKVTRLGLLIPAVGIGVLLAAADQTIVVTSYGRIGSDLKALNNTSWIATA
jgi:hypothetical protein